MSVIWHKVIDDVNYEVRRAGKTTRLYTDGVFHSQYHPNRHIIGGIWDLLVLPSFFYSPDQLSRVLLLGVGGGAVIHHLIHFHHSINIIGIELNPIHIHIAKKYFHVSDKIATVIEADAELWLQQYSGPKFDIIIDDLFGEQQGQPVRAIDANINWFKLIEKHLDQNAMFICNFVSSKELRSCGYFQSNYFSNIYDSVFQFTLPAFENAIAAFVKKPVKNTDLKKRIYQYQGINSISLPYRCRTFK